ncbi:MAG TPA: autotransporter-associated beta strand repeat-containing protein [Tepidisphaeraceae bacterium]|jgi:autotransporter-associated beta strand protein|nr:autotransporter-associated beta strand repeat-containing protein [Tepidisphaeraceae bacterium]
MDKKQVIGKRAILIAAALSGLASSAYAASGTWQVNANGVWDGGITDTANWLSGVSASGSGNTADFTIVELTADRTVTLGAPITIGNISFADVTPSNNWIITSTNPANFLTLDGTTPTITVNDATRTATIGAMVAGVAGLTKAGAGSLTLTALPTYSGLTTVGTGSLNLNFAAGSAYTNASGYSVTSGAVLNLNSAGTIILNGAGSGSGITRLSQGTLVVGNSAVFGSTSILFAGGTIVAAGDQILTNAATLNAGATTGFAGSNNLTLAGLVTNSGGNATINNNLLTGETLTLSGGLALSESATARTVIVTGLGNTVVSGPITSGGGASSVTKQGIGSLTIKGAANYSGVTTLQSGTVTVDMGAGGSIAGTLNFSSQGNGGAGGPGAVVTPVFVLKSKAAGSGGVITLGAGALGIGNSDSQIIVNSTAGGTVTLDDSAGTFSRGTGNSNGVLDVSFLGSNGTMLIGNGGSPGLQNGLFPYVTYNRSDFATLVGTTVSAYAGYATFGVGTGSGGAGIATLSNGSTTNAVVTSASSGAINVGIGTTTQLSTLTYKDTASRVIDFGSGGTLNLGVKGALLVSSSAGPLTIGAAANVGTLSAGGSTANAAGELILINDSANDLTLNSRIGNHGSGAVSVTKSGTGRLILNGSNTFSGVVAVDGGTLMIGSSGQAALGTNTTPLIQGGATLDINGNNILVNSFNGGGNITNSSATIATVSLGNNNTNTNTVNLSYHGNMILSKVGTGSIQMNSLGNDYTGGNMLNAGTIRLAGGANVLTGTITFAGNNAQIFDPNATTRNNPIIVNPGITGIYHTNQNGFTLSGTLSGSGTFDLFNDGNTFFVYGMDASGFTGTLRDDRQNSLNIPTSTAGSANGRWLLGGGGAGVAQQVTWTGTGDGLIQIGELASLTGIPTLRNSVAGTMVTYQIGNLGTSTSFIGNFVDNVGTTALTKVGNGAFTITGTNTYTGATTVNAGTLAMAVALGNSPITINGGTLILGAGGGTGTTTITTGNMVLTGTRSSAVTNINGGGTLYAIGASTLGSATASGVVVAGGSSPALQGGINLIDSSINTLNINSTAGTALALGGPNAGDRSVLNFEMGATNTADRILLNNASGAALVNSGGATVNVAAFGAWNGPGTYDLITAPGGGIDGTKFSLGSAPVGFYNYSFSNSTATDLILTVTGAPMPTTAFWKGDVSGDWAGGTSANTNWATDAGGATDTQQMPGGISNVVFSASGAGNLSTTLNAKLGIQSLRFGTSGTSVTVGGTGQLGIGASGLTVDSGAAANTLSLATVSLDANQVWTNNSTNLLTVSSAVTGPGGLTVMGGGSGPILFSGNNSYAGGTTISTGGVLRLGSSTALGAGSLTMAGGTLDLNNRNVTVSALTGSSGTILNGTAGIATLNFNTAAGIGASSSVTIVDGTGTVAVGKDGTGSLTLAGVNNYTGGTVISGGTLDFASDAALGAPSSPVIFNGVLTNPSGALEPTVGGLTVNRPIQVNSGATGTISLANGSLTISGPVNGAGTLNLGGANTATFTNSTSASTGTINVNTSTLVLGADSALGASTTVVGAGGTFDLNGHTLGGTAAGAGGLFISATGATVINSNATTTGVISANTALNQPNVSVWRVMGPGNVEIDSPWSGQNDSEGRSSYLLKLGNSTLTIGGTVNNGQARIQIGTFDTTGSGAETGGGTVVLNKLNTTVGAGANALRFLAVNSGTLVFGPNVDVLTSAGFGEIGGLRLSGKGVIDLNGQSGGNTTVESLNNGDFANFLNVGIGTTGFTTTGGGITPNTIDFGNGTILNNSTNAATMTVGGNNGNSGTNALVAFTGNIQDGIGTVSIVKTGSGTFAITTNNGNYDNGFGAPSAAITAVDGNSGNTFSGGFYVIGGSAFIGADDALGTGTIGLNGGEFASFDTIAHTFANPVNLAGNAQAGDATRTGTLNFNGNGFITANATLTTNSPVIMNGIISGPSSASLTKAGSSILTLTNNNTYAGPTNINAGTLAITSLNGLNTTAYVNVASGGTLSVPGSFSTPSTLTVAGTGGVIIGGYTHGAGTISPGSGGGGFSAGTVSFASGLALNSGGSTFIDLSGTTTNSDLVAVTGGSLNMAGGKIELNFLSAPTGLPRTYTIATYGSKSGALGNLTVESRASIGTVDTGSAINVTVNSYTAGNLTWSGLTSGNGQWDLSTTPNWTNSVSSADKFFQLDNVSFVDAPATVQNNVNLTTQVAPASIVVNNTNTAYTISGNGTISGATGITKTGSGSLTITAATNYTGTTTVAGGRLVLGSKAWGPALTIAGSAGADVKGGRLVYDYNGTTTPAATVATLLTNGYAQTTKFSSGLIHSSTATPTGLGLGWVDNTAASQVSVVQTYYGDANLDGTVNIADFNAVALDYGQSAQVWSTGDFNYDGIVNLLDLNAVATNYGQTTSVPAAPFVLNGATPALGTLVPEPASLGLIGLGLTTLASRRTRRNRNGNRN